MFLILVMAGLIPAAVDDSRKDHVENVTTSSHAYRLTLGGVMDGTNSRNPIGYSAPIQWFEPMRSVRIENVGDRDVVNPWITVNGKRHWRTSREIAAEALATYGDPAKMSNAEKARAIWEFERHHRFHATTWDAEVQDPVKMLNVYGYTLCGDEAQVLADLWRLAGLKTRRGFPTGHVVSEAWYDGAWHLLDSDEHVVCLLRDNETIASEEEVVRDHDLVKRTHTYGILSQDSRKTDEFSASLYAYDGKREGEHGSHVGHTMNFTLRPGEALEWRWDHKGKEHNAERGLKDWSETAIARLRNGVWSYKPDLRSPAAPRGVVSAENVRWEGRVAPEKADRPASLVWKIASPYVLVGGRLRAKGDGIAAAISFDQKTWSPLVPDADLDPFFPSKGTPRYAYWIRLEVKGGLDSIEFQNDLQMAALGLPSLELGENAIAYADETKEAHAVRITHHWIEREGPPAPAAPTGGEVVEGPCATFQWKAPAGKIADYQFQLGDRADLKWVLSPNFDKLVSNTGDRGKAQVTLTDAGLLNPGQRYSWRVRAMDDRHLWGAWTATWSFVPGGPGVPLHLKWTGTGLAWEVNPKGTAPARYEVHASNEKGFTATDRETPVLAGNQKEGGLYPGKEFVAMPATRITTVTVSSFDLRPAHAFYRVIALDEKGSRSGASDVLAAPRPRIFTGPVTEARAGSPYRYEAKSIASLGDLRCRMIGAECYNAAFWDAEKPRFALSKGPAWLKMDPATGILGGTPGAADAGEVEVRIAVETPGVGSDAQTFTIRVR